MAPARTHSRKISRSLSISISTTFMFGTRLTISQINAQSDSRAVTESKIKTSAPDAPTEEVVSGRQEEAPHTLKSPLLLRSLARASRSRRFPATKKTEDALFGMWLPGNRLGYLMRD